MFSLKGRCVLLCMALAGCDSSPPPISSSASDVSDIAPPSAQAATDNATQAAADLNRARQTLPGRSHYETLCATCHEGAVKKAPHREMIALMTPEAILQTLTAGIMKSEASELSDAERTEVAEYLGGRAIGTSAIDSIPTCGPDIDLDLDRPPHFTNWGLQPANTRQITTERAGISRADLSNLKPKWALRFPGANRARSQPTLAGGLLFVGSHGGTVYALDQNTGCSVWQFQASGEVRTGFAIDRWTAGSTYARPQIYFGDILGNVYAVQARSGKLVWRARADDHPNATITGTPSLHNGWLFVPVSALEVSLAIDPTYECCTFRGSVAAFDTADGARQWQTYTIDQLPTVQSRNSAGTNMRGPSGAMIWNSPTIDIARDQLYVGTGENMSSPATLTSDALFALDLSTGVINWSFQATANDVWNTACDTDTPASCPPEGGPDFDFGAATMLVTTSAGQDLVLGGQKSGMVHALNPDTGELMWQTQVARGGIQGGIHFGMAAADGTLFVPVTDMPDGRTYTEPPRPGVHAVDIETGKRLWYSPSPNDICKGRSFCHPGISQAITVVGDMTFAGGMDGVLRVRDNATGAVLWQLDTTQPFVATTGGTTSGGSFGGAAGPIVQDSLVVLSSGYGIYNHMAGNLLLVLAAD